MNTPVSQADEKRRKAHQLWREAIDADLAFSVELRRVYGADAGEARYYRSHADAGCQNAMMAKLHADDAWHAEIVAGR